MLPADVNHPEVEPLAIGRRFGVKINSNIGKRGRFLYRGEVEKTVGESVAATP